MKNKKLFIRNFSNGNCEYVEIKEKRKSKKLPSFKVHSENEHTRIATWESHGPSVTSPGVACDLLGNDHATAGPQANAPVELHSKLCCANVVALWLVLSSQ